VLVVLWRLAGALWLSGVALLVACLSLLRVSQASIAELRVTNLELQSSVRGTFGSRRSVSRADIRWLEYQEDSSGLETSHHPGGLYAVLRLQSVCLLPYVNEQQTAQIIERIVTKFPDLGKQSNESSSFGAHFISLGLNDPTTGQ
jgi:hypothetical protein